MHTHSTTYTYIRTYVPSMHIHAYIHTYLHMYTRTYMHKCIHAYVYTYIPYTRKFSRMAIFPNWLSIVLIKIIMFPFHCKISAVLYFRKCCFICEIHENYVMWKFPRIRYIHTISNRIHTLILSCRQSCDCSSSKTARDGNTSLVHETSWNSHFTRNAQTIPRDSTQFTYCTG